MRGALALLVALLALVVALPASAGDIYLPDPGKAWFGSTDSDTLTNATLESSVLAGKRQVDIIHVYKAFSNYSGTKAFPGNSSAGVPLNNYVAAHKMLYLGYMPKIGGQPVAGGWAAVARGEYDAAYIDPFLTKLRDWSAANGGKKVFIDFHHEADHDQKISSAWGSSTDYRNAARHFIERAVALGARDAMIHVWTMGAGSGNPHIYHPMYPGDDVTDWLGYDPYGKVKHTSKTSSRTWHKTFGNDELDSAPDASSFYRFYDWCVGRGVKDAVDGKTYRKQDIAAVPAADLTKPIMVAEFNSAYDPTLDKPNLSTWRTFWNGGVTEVGANRYPQVRAFLGFFSVSPQFDPRNDVGTGSVANPSPGSILERFRALAALSRLNSGRPY